MRMTGPQAVSHLRTKLQVEFGRHLYAALGTYEQLERFAVHLAKARDAAGRRLPDPVNLNRALLARIGDDDLNALVRAEPRRPTAVQDRLAAELRALVVEHLEASNLLILRQFELLFAHKLELDVFRVLATDQRRILLLLPGLRVGQTISLFHEADERFHRVFPASLVTEDHLWELTDG